MNMASPWFTPKRLLWASVAVAIVTIALKRRLGVNQSEAMFMTAAYTQGMNAG